MHNVDTASHSAGSKSSAEHSFLTAAHRSNGSPHPLKSLPEKDKPIVALTELQIQRFGHKVHTELPARPEQSPEVQSVPLRFFQIEQSHEGANTSAASESGGSDVTGTDETAFSLQQSLQDNITGVDTGFVADAQAAVPVPVQDSQGVGYGASQQAPNDLPAGTATAMSPEDEESWKEFTKEEALLESSLEASETGYRYSRSYQLSILLLVTIVIVVIGGLCLIAGFFASFIWQKQLDSPTRSLIEELPVSCASEIEKKLPSTGSYDCTFSKPLSSCELIRLEARVEAACEGASEITAPLSGKPCVLHSVQVSRHLHHGVHPVPIAFTSASVDFIVSLKDAPQIRIEIRGEDVSLFDVGAGQTLGRHAFADAPESWQDFILTHRAAHGHGWQAHPHARSDDVPLDFQECALPVGTLVTFVGELHRGADGKLSLRPLQLDRLSEDLLSAPCQRSWASDLSERWRTSWERSAQPTSPGEEGEKSKTHFAKVLASDDAQLLTGSTPNSALSMACSLLRRFPSACSARALDFANSQCSARKVVQA